MSRERVAALALLLFGLGGVFGASRLTIGGPGRPGPGFFPFWLALALCVAAVALLLRRSPAPPQPPAVLAERLRYGKVVLALAAGAAYAAALGPLGFLLTTFLFLLFLLRAVDPRRWSSALVISAATSVASHLLFKVWLDVQLPAGPWGF
jgi:putative tricarboxylic transport membrane protein